jgi:hypothetical protein
MKRLLGIITLAITSSLSADDLTPDAQAKLDANGLVIIDQPLSQAFSAYVGARRPVFVTSDSLLMAYHRIFEELVGEIEVGQLIHFRVFWREFWKNLPESAGEDADEAAKEGHRRARLLVATAHRLLFGANPEDLNESEAAAVAEEVRRVEAGEGGTVPSWILGSPTLEDRVSYPAFIPRGISEGNESTERYYRFRKWLQEMKLSFGDGSTASMLAFLGISIAEIDSDHLDFIDDTSLFGDLETGILNQLSEHCDTWRADDSITEHREDLSANFGNRPRWRLFDTLIPGGSKITREILNTRPERVSQTPLVVGKSLGNPIAISLLDEELSKAADCGDFLLEEEWQFVAINHYFEALRGLNHEPDDRVPPLIRSEAWKRKQLNTTLGSWAEYRYALGLAAREDIHTFGVFQQEPGFVEPLPDFYRHLGEAAESFLTLRTRQLSTHTERGAWILRLEGAARLMRQIEKEGGVKRGQTLQADSELRPFWGILPLLFPLPEGSFYLYPPINIENPQSCGRWAGMIETFAKSWWEGDPDSLKLLESATIEEPDILGPRLLRLAGVCFRLEAMAERQLAGRPWTDLDKKFLDQYGATLGWLMFYEGNSYLDPRDDSPRTVRYATLTDTDGKARIHHAATSQPRLFLIRYPDREGKEVLCQGAAYAFRNIESDSTPTRGEWIQQARTSTWPEWISPIVGSYGPTKQD